MKIKFKKLHKDSILPTPALPGDVGYDLMSIEDVTLAPGVVTKVKTGVCLASYDPNIKLNVDESLTIYPEIKSRSGLASRGVIVVGGIIDTKYRGELIVLLLNTTNSNVIIRRNDKCAQFVFTACLTNPSLIIEEDNIIEQTERGANGFGSTDKD